MGTGAEVWAVPAAVGALGLYQQDQANDASKNAVKKGLKAQESVDAPKIEAMNALLQLAKNYDPTAETAGLVKQAKSETADTLSKTLASLNSKYSLSGSPGNTTNFQLDAQKATNETLGPFAAWVAQQGANATQKKANLLSSVFGANVGNVSDAYFKSAQLNAAADQPATGAISLISQGLQNLWPSSGSQKSTSGSGPGSSNALDTSWTGSKKYSIPINYGSGTWKAN